MCVVERNASGSSLRAVRVRVAPESTGGIPFATDERWRLLDLGGEALPADGRTDLYIL